MYRLIQTLVLASVLISLTAHASDAIVKTVEANGTTFEYVEQGTGTPVVFVHGALSDHRIWEAYRESISANYRFVSYTRRYFGKQPWADKGERFSRKQHAEDLVEFIQAISDEPVHLFTWSSGGNVGTHANTMRPDLVRSVVHFEPVVFSLASQIPGITAAQSQQFDGMQDVFALLGDKNSEQAGLRFLEIVWDLPKGQGNKVATPAVRQMLGDNARTIPPMMRAMPHFTTTCEVLARLQTPTLILKGEQSKPFFAMYAEYQGRCQANAVVATVSGVNHNGPAVAVQALTDQALAFYKMF